VFRGITAYRYFIFGVGIIIVMIFRPQGLIPSKRRKAELRQGTSETGLYDVMHSG
jgi:branched-chain amino acid transport system permease protein